MKASWYRTTLYHLLICLLVSCHGMSQADDKHLVANDTKPATPKNLSLMAGIATTFRTEDATEQSIWQIPGVLMGGNAEAPEQGLTLDDVFLSLSWTDHEAISALFELSQHGDHETELEQAYFSYVHQFSLPLSAEFTAGRLKGGFSPENSTHASHRSFSENNLLYDAFFGGYYVDEGLRIELSPGDVSELTLGAEIWRGASFPATPGSGGGAQDIYIHWHHQSGSIRLESGIWGLLARAEDRGDDRFEDGHNHGNNVEDNNIDFDGTQRLAGVFASLLWQAWAQGELKLKAEFIDVEVQGDIVDPTRQAELEGSYQGYYVQPEIRFDHHQLALRYARLLVDNHLTGAGGPGLAEDAELYDMGRDPSEFDVSYRYIFDNGIGIRLEWNDNQTTRKDSDYFGIGVFWSSVLY